MTMALGMPSVSFRAIDSTVIASPNPNSTRRTEFLPSGLHTSLCSPFSRIGFESLAAVRRVETPLRSCRRSHQINALFGLGVPELVVIAGVTALIFGPKKLPEIGKSLGKTVKSFQQAAKEFESEIKQGAESTQVEPSKTETLSAAPEKEKENAEL